MAIEINDQFMCPEMDGAVVAFAREDSGRASQCGIPSLGDATGLTIAIQPIMLPDSCPDDETEDEHHG